MGASISNRLEMVVELRNQILATKKWKVLLTSVLKPEEKSNLLQSVCNFPERFVSARDTEWYSIRDSSSTRLEVMSILILKCQITIFR